MGRKHYNNPQIIGRLCLKEEGSREIDEWTRAWGGQQAHIFSPSFRPHGHTLIRAFLPVASLYGASKPIYTQSRSQNLLWNVNLIDEGSAAPNKLTSSPCIFQPWCPSRLPVTFSLAMRSVVSITDVSFFVVSFLTKRNLDRDNMATTPSTRAKWRRYKATCKVVSTREKQIEATHQGPAISNSRDWCKMLKMRPGMASTSLSRVDVSQEYRDKGDKRRDTVEALREAASQGIALLDIKDFWSQRKSRTSASMSSSLIVQIPKCSS